MQITIVKKIANFVKYHNAFTISLILVFVFSGVIFASSENARDAVFSKKIITEIGIDNTELLDTDLDKFDFNITITNVSEDEQNYYVDYFFHTLGIHKNIWQTIKKQSTMNVSKISLQSQDLEECSSEEYLEYLKEYLIEELGEITDYELVYLKQVQEAENKIGETEIEITVEHTGLIGSFLDMKEKYEKKQEQIAKEKAEKIAEEKARQEEAARKIAEIARQEEAAQKIVAEEKAKQEKVAELAKKEAEEKAKQEEATRKIAEIAEQEQNSQSVCDSFWQCGDWSPSINFITLDQEFTQYRNCVDMNECDINNLERIEQQTAYGVLFESVVITNSINCDSFLIDGIEYVSSTTFDGVEYFYEFCK